MARQSATQTTADNRIDTALYERTKVSNPKLSTVLRQIAPQAEQVFRDQYVLEFLGGKDYKSESSHLLTQPNQQPVHRPQMPLFTKALKRLNRHNAYLCLLPFILHYAIESF